MTNCSRIAGLPSLTSLAQLTVLDLENCTGLTTLPSLPAGLDVLVLSGCESMRYVQPSCADPGSLHGPAVCSEAQHPEEASSGAGPQDDVVDSQTPGIVARHDTTEVIIEALPPSLTEVQVGRCPLFSSSESRAMLTAHVLSNRLAQWDRFKQADVLLRYT